MTVPGYRGTSPPHVYIARTREELESIEVGSSYSDPFDLKNTLVSFEYNMDKNSLWANVKLVNPGSSIEERLFAAYNAWTQKSHQSKMSEVDINELVAQVGEMESFYIRWGYVSTKGQGQPHEKNDYPVADTALSHIHKFVLMDMTYDFSQGRDRIVILQLLNTWDNSYKGKSFNATPRTFTVPLDEREGPETKRKWRRPSAVFQELLLQMLTGNEEYVGYSKFSEEQDRAIDTAFDYIVKNPDLTLKDPDPSGSTWVPSHSGGLQMPTYDPDAVPDLDPSNDYFGRYDPTNPEESKPYIAMHQVRKFYEAHGYTLLQDTGKMVVPNSGDLDAGTPYTVYDPSERLISFPAVSHDQTTGRVYATPNDPDVINPDIQAITCADCNPDCMGGGATPKRYHVPPALMLITKDANQQAIPPMPIPIPVEMFYAVPSDNPDMPLKIDLTVNDLQSMVDGEHFYVIYDDATIADYAVLQAQAIVPLLQKPKPHYNYPAYHEQPNFDLPAGLPGQSLDQGEKRFPMNFLHKKHLEDQIEEQKALQRSAAQEAVGDNDLNQPLDPELEHYESTGGPLPYSLETQADLLDAAEGPINYLRLNVPAGELWASIAFIVDKLNRTYFKRVDRYLQVGRLELAAIPPDKRPFINEKLPNLKFDWDSDAGLIILGTTRLWASLYNWTGPITSFSGLNIKNEASEGDYDISLAVGYNNRKDNIVSDVRWRLNKGSMLFDMRAAPVAAQHMYNMAKRFEDPARRDVVVSVVNQQLKSSAGDDYIHSVELTGSDDKLGTSSLVVGDQVFVGAAVKYAISQLRRETGNTGQDATDVAPDSIKAMEAQAREDLIFILHYDLLDAFFPRVNPEDAAKIKQRYLVDAPGQDQKVHEIAHFRYLATSPLGILTNTNDDEIKAELMLSKLQVLNMFAKRITNVQVDCLGVPELDIFENEIMNRNVMLRVHEPRVPGTTHWLSGIYNVLGITHTIDSGAGYVMNLRLIRSSSDTEEMFATNTLLAPS